MKSLQLIATFIVTSAVEPISCSAEAELTPFTMPVTAIEGFWATTTHACAGEPATDA